MSDNIQFRGIVALGSSRNQAVQRYTLASMGKGVSMFVDNANATAFVSNASADLENVFNPANGNMDLEKSDEALQEHLEFSAKAGDVHEAYHYECTAGCGMHVVFDNKDLVKNCPACSTAIASDGDEDEVEDEEEDFDLDEDEIAALDEEGDEDEEEIEDEEEDETSLSSDDDDSDEEEDEEIEDEEEEDFSEDDADDSDEDEALDSDEDDSMDDAPLVVTAASKKAAVSNFSRLAGQRVSAGVALASGDSNAVTAHYKVCASAEGCGAHVIGEVALDVCPRPTCGEELSEPTAATAADEGDDVSLSLIDEDDSDDELGLGEDEEDTDDGSDEGEDDSEDSADEEEEEEADDSADSDDSDDEEEDETATASAGDTAEDNGSGEGATAGDETEEVSVDLLEQVPEDASIDDTDIAHASSIGGQPVWTAYYKGQPVAVATAGSIRKDHADLFLTPRFGTATAAAAKVSGVKSVLSQMGFVGIKAKLHVTKHVETRAAALAATAASSLDEKFEQRMNGFEAAVATAAIGVNRGFFEGLSNPLRETLLAGLAGVNFRNPEAVVDPAMRNGFEEFMRVVVAKAREILDKPPEVQESLARTVVEMTYQPKTNGMQATASAGGQNLEDRISQVGIAATASADEAINAATQVATQHTAVASGDDFQSILAKAMGGLGKRS